MALGFMKDLVHFDVKYSTDVVKYFLKCIISDSIIIRKTALRVFVYITVQNKPEFKKITIDPYQTAGVHPETKTIVPGYRADNQWLLYSLQSVPKNEEEWNQPR